MAALRQWSARSRSISSRRSRRHWRVAGTQRSLWPRRAGRRKLGKCYSALSLPRAAQEMIENSKKWAIARGLLEVSEVHGKEEWRIPVSRKFGHLTKTGQMTKQKTTFQVEDHLQACKQSNSCGLSGPRRYHLQERREPQ